jgi:NADPH:quinone reductase-like Zn-dependent oxidoreductase
LLTAVREVYGEPETVALRDVDRPTVGDHEVLVEVLGGRTRSGGLASRHGPAPPRPTYGVWAAET